MSDQRPPSNALVEMWRMAVSGAVAICSVTACAAIVFAGLAFTHGGAQISFHELNISLPSRASVATPPPPIAPEPVPMPEVVPPPPAVPPVAQLAIPYLGILYRETTVNPSHQPGAMEYFSFRPDGRRFVTIDRSDQSGNLDLCGARVMAVRPDSPAERVGLQAGDVIIGVDDRGLVDGLDLRSRIRGANVGQQVTLHLYRDDRLIRFPVVLGVLPLGDE